MLPVPWRRDSDALEIAEHQVFLGVQGVGGRTLTDLLDSGQLLTCCFACNARGFFAEGL